jgi:hypothetical protein
MSGILQALEKAGTSEAGIRLGAGQSAEDHLALSLAARQIGQSDYSTAEQYLTKSGPAASTPVKGRLNDPRPAISTPSTAGDPALILKSIHLKNSACDDAIARFRSFQAKPEDPFVLAKPIPGISYPSRTAN